jgi:hypothetical protein
MDAAEMEWKTAPPAPKRNTRIWRYMSRPVFLDLVTNRRLTFHQFKDLQRIDAREGMVVPGFWESVVEYQRQSYPNTDFDELRARVETSLDRTRCFAYASCWSMAKDEDILMWKAYAPKGIAIRTTVGKFINAPQAAGTDRLTIQRQKIVYANHWRELERRGYRHRGIPLNKLFLHTKRKGFLGERELRFRISPALPLPYILQPNGSSMQDASHCWQWFSIVFENLDWIDEIVAESSLPSRTVATIRRLANQHNLKFRISNI